MLLVPDQRPPVPTKPQLHSSRCHDSYNGTRTKPIATWVRGLTFREMSPGDFALVYEIMLYYKHNRACVLYRSWEDFQTLKRDMPTWKNQPTFTSRRDSRNMHRFLKQALVKEPKHCGLEYFLRRRMGDCGGR